jgi:hypothetical protein
LARKVRKRCNKKQSRIHHFLSYFFFFSPQHKFGFSANNTKGGARPTGAMNKGTTALNT